MATSKCPNCPSNEFECVNGKVMHAEHPFLFVQCSKCGTIISVHDHAFFKAHFEELEKRLGKS
jgi:uncharacterized Zn finger protein